MAGFGSSGRYGCSDNSNKQRLTGKIEDIKPAPQHGEKRLIVREKGGGKSIAIDIDTDCSTGLERKQSYNFLVEEKNATRSGQGSRMKSPSFKSYHCEDEPSVYGSGSSWDSTFNRFGNSERGGGSDRNKRKFT